MADSDQRDAVFANLAAASTTLRETAKWLVGGVAATAAGLFAGSSLTNLGSMALPDDWQRLFTAFVGAALGFACVGNIAWRGLAVMSVRSISFRQLINEAAGASKQVVDALDDRHKPTLPGQASSLAALRDKIVAENAKPPAERDADFVRHANEFVAMLMAEASFERVSIAFERLKRILLTRLLGAVIGFGIFAWAANPPPPPSAPPPPVVQRP